MIICDDMGHLVSTTSEEELHNFAAKLGLKREWYHDTKPRKIFPNGHSHYDLTTQRMRNKAVDAGARRVHSFELIKTAWWRK